MHILLANYWNLRSFDYPLSLAYIAMALRSEGIKFEVRDYNFCKDQRQAFFHDIQTENFDVILLGGHLGNYSYKHLKETCHDIKKFYPEILIITGGPMVSCAPRLILENMDIDVVVIGEGERTIVDVIHRLKDKNGLKDCHGIAYKDHGEIVITPPKERISDLDALPYPAYDLFPTKQYVDYMKKVGYGFAISGSRGCFNNCSFCFRPFGQRVTRRSGESIKDEMLCLYKTYGVSKFNFVDENFLSSKRIIKEFCSLLANLGSKFEWRCQSRLDLLDETTVASMVESGLQHGISIGFESGSQLILDTIGKHATIELYEKCIAILRKFNVAIYPNFIIGFPEESRETLQDTRDFITRHHLTNLWLNYLVPYPGTALYAYALNKEIITDEDAYCESIGPLGKRLYINLTRFSDEELDLLRKEYFGDLPVRNIGSDDPLAGMS